MGQQQLLLIILGVLVVGLAVAVGITIFQDNAISLNRDAVNIDLVNLGALAQMYYRRPEVMAGGAGTFNGLTLKMLTSKPKNSNGSYTVTSVSPTQVVLDGVGVEKGNDGDPLSLSVTVFSDSMFITLNN